MPNRSCSAGNIRFKRRKFDIAPLFYERSTREQRSEFPNQRWLNLNLPKSFTGSLWIQVQEPTGAVAFTVIRQSPGVLTTFPAIVTAQPVTPGG